MATRGRTRPGRRRPLTRDTLGRGVAARRLGCRLEPGQVRIFVLVARQRFQCILQAEVCLPGLHQEAANSLLFPPSCALYF